MSSILHENPTPWKWGKIPKKKERNEPCHVMQLQTITPPPPKLHSGLDWIFCDLSRSICQVIFFSVWIQQIEFWFIWPDDIFPFFRSPWFVFLCPFQTSPFVFFCQFGFVFLDSAWETAWFQCSGHCHSTHMNVVGRLKDFRNACGCCRFLFFQQSDCQTFFSDGKFGRVPSSGQVLEVVWLTRLMIFWMPLTERSVIWEICLFEIPSFFKVIAWTLFSWRVISIFLDFTWSTRFSGDFVNDLECAQKFFHPPEKLFTCSCEHISMKSLEILDNGGRWWFEESLKIWWKNILMLKSYNKNKNFVGGWTNFWAPLYMNRYKE